MEELKGIAYLREKLNRKRIGVIQRYEYYDMKNFVPDFGISTPPQLRGMQAVLGWCGKAVDSIADRLDFYQFENDNFGINDIYAINNSDVLYDSAILGALIGSCSFIHIYKNENEEVALEVIDGANATGILDARTGLLTEGYAVLKRNEGGDAVSEAYFTPDETIYYQDGQEIRVENPAKYPLLVPIVYRPDATRPFGHSRISRACMSIIKSASRTIKRSEISAEFFSFPQKYITGLAENAEITDKWKAAMSAMMTFTKDEEGDHPIMGQFAQQSMTPHLDQLRMFASLFAGETGLTIDDLGFATDNPSSAEAIKASHENLRLLARKAQKQFGIGFLNAGYLAASLRDNMAYERNKLYETKPVWNPIFEPDSAMLSGIGDGVIKINQAVPDYFSKENLRKLTGIDSEA